MTALMLLSSCYDSNESWGDRMRPSLTTYPATVAADKVVFHGETTVNSPILFFELSPSKEFVENETRRIYASYSNDSIPNVYAELTGLIQPGTQYVRLCSQVSDTSEVISADNVVEIFIENPLKTLDAYDITERSAVLAGLYEGSSQYYPGNKYFEISTNPDFTDRRILNDFSNHYPDEDGDVVYELVAGNLNPATDYYVRFCCSGNETDIKGNTVKFTTANGVLLEIGKITCPDPSYNLTLFVNMQNTSEYTQVDLTYDKAKDSYVPISNQNIILLPEARYNVSVVNSESFGVSYFDTTNNGRLYADFVDNGGWRIFYAKTVVDYNSPKVSLEAEELTCMVTFEFPSLGSGNFGFELRSRSYNNIFPDCLYVDEGEFFSEGYFWTSMIFVNNERLFMIPVEITSDDDVIIEVNTPRGYSNYDMSPVKMEAGGIYRFVNGKLVSDNSELGASDVTVDSWEETQGDDVTIIPK